MFHREPIADHDADDFDDREPDEEPYNAWDDPDMARKDLDLEDD